MNKPVNVAVLRYTIGAAKDVSRVELKHSDGKLACFMLFSSHDAETRQKILDELTEKHAELLRKGG